VCVVQTKVAVDKVIAMRSRWDRQRDNAIETQDCVPGTAEDVSACRDGYTQNTCQKVSDIAQYFVAHWARYGPCYIAEISRKSNANASCCITYRVEDATAAHVTPVGLHHFVEQDAPVTAAGEAE